MRALWEDNGQYRLKLRNQHQWTGTQHALRLLQRFEAGEVNILGRPPAGDSSLGTMNSCDIEYIKARIGFRGWEPIPVGPILQVPRLRGDSPAKSNELVLVFSGLRSRHPMNTCPAHSSCLLKPRTPSTARQVQHRLVEDSIARWVRDLLPPRILSGKRNSADSSSSLFLPYTPRLSQSIAIYY